MWYILNELFASVSVKVVNIHFAAPQLSDYPSPFISIVVNKYILLRRGKPLDSFTKFLFYFFYSRKKTDWVNRLHRIIEAGTISCTEIHKDCERRRTPAQKS